jgi:hypothetical protein
MKDRIKLVQATGYNLSTVGRWARGEHVSESTNRQLLKACSELGLRRENEDPKDDGDA